MRPPSNIVSLALLVACGSEPTAPDSSAPVKRFAVATDPFQSADAFKLMPASADNDDALGFAIAAAGDIDGDGRPDLVAGAPDADVAGSPDAGEAWVYYGDSAGIAPVSRETRVRASIASAGDAFGRAVTGMGDVDLDGFDDVVIAAPLADNAGTDSGALHLLRGGSTGIGAPSAAIVAMDTDAGDALGAALAGPGDLDGDGRPDLVAGAPGDATAGANAGAIYVFSGTSAGLGAAAKILAPDAAAGDTFGLALGAAGDVNGDGIPDVVIGAPRDDDRGNNAGAIYVAYGGSGGLSAARMDKITAADGAAGDLLGAAVAGAGDINDDGFDDIVVGAPGSDAGAPGAGAAYVFLGSSTGISTTGTRLLAPSPATDAAFGTSVATAGRADGDAFADVLVGAPFEGGLAGAVYRFEGTAGGILATGATRLVPSDLYAKDAFGFALALCGDLDGDGIDDLAVGARDSFLDTTTRPGAVYVFSPCLDGDGDGLCAGTDCDDTDPAAGAGDADADGVCDGDDLCIGDDASGDTDGDGWCDDGGTGTPDDCDPTDPATFPGADEACDGLDNDCDGIVPSDEWDADGDGVRACDGDCDDLDATVLPQAPELCDGRDNDCDGVVPADERDVDSDGVLVCAGDCDDADPRVNPLACETCADEIDNDCDGDVDEGACVVPREDAKRIDDQGGCACSSAEAPTTAGLATLAALAGMVLARRRRA